MTNGHIRTRLGINCFSTTCTAYVLAAMVLVGLVICGVIVFLNEFTVVHTMADYGTFALDGRDGQYWRFSSSTPSRCDVYIQTPHNRRCSINAISDELIESNGFFSMKDDDPAGFYDTYYTGFGGNFLIKDYKLIGIDFAGSELAFSNRLDGEYIRLPVDYERFHKLFGRPKHIEKTRRWRAH